MRPYAFPWDKVGGEWEFVRAPNPVAMPRVNPESSFEVSARHLFRHIREADALRENPLVRHLLPVGSGIDDVDLSEIHRCVIAAASRVCNELEAQGLSLVAVRRRAIVAALCDGEEPEQTALRLGISRSQYYRERRAISVAVARALREGSAARHGSAGVVRDDALRLLFRRAEALRDAGRSFEAVRMLDDAYAGIDDDFTKAAVGMALAEELVFLGGHDRARELIARSAELPVESDGGVNGDHLRDTWTLNRARLESQLSSAADAGSALEVLAKRRIGQGRSDDVTFSAAFLTGEWYRNAGRYAEARAMLGNLQKMDSRLLRGAPKRLIAIHLLEAFCAESGSDELGVAERSLREALELGVSSGTLVGSLLAMAGLIGHSAAAGCDGDAYEMAREALRMAQGADFSGFLGYVMVEIAGAVLQTRYWRMADPLVFELENLASPRSFALARLKLAQGAFFMRSGRQHLAREPLLDGLAAARQLGNRRLEGLLLRDYAVSLGARSTRERVGMMREAVELIEGHGNSDDLLATYEAAARVIGDPHSVRLARQAQAAVRDRVSFDSAAVVREPDRVVPLRLPKFAVG